MDSCAHTCIYTQNVYSEDLRHFTWDYCTAPNVSVPQENRSWISGLVPENIQMLIYFLIFNCKYKQSINLINSIIFLGNLISCVKKRAPTMH